MAVEKEKGKKKKKLTRERLQLWVLYEKRNSRTDVRTLLSSIFNSLLIDMNHIYLIYKVKLFIFDYKYLTFFLTTYKYLTFYIH